MDGQKRTVLITGASAGIGKAFAEKFADRGFDLVLVARRQDRLEELAEGLRSRHGCEVLVFATDLADRDATIRLFEELDRQGVVVDALVNNAGFGIAATFTETPWSEQADYLQVMLTSVAELTHKVLPGMKERGYGRIINVSSLAAWTPEVPGNLYGAIKIFLVRMTRSLALELVDSGVNITAVCPGFTYSEFHDVAGNRGAVSKLPRLLWMDAETVAHQGYEAVMAGKTVLVNGRLNNLIGGVFALLPDRISDALAIRLSVMRRD